MPKHASRRKSKNLAAQPDLSSGTPRLPFVVTFNGETHAVASIEEASRVYCAARDASGEGASTWDDGCIQPGNLRISYNGRVWNGDKPWAPGDVPVFDNRSVA